MLERDDTDAARPPRQRLRVLLLEHDPAEAERCVRLLRFAGFAITADTVGHAREFRARLRDSSYDVVLADYGLPGCTALDALAAVRAEGLEIPLILINGTRMDERAVKCIEAGAAGYLMRGNLVHLSGAVRRVLDERRKRHVAVLESQNPPPVERRCFPRLRRVTDEMLSHVRSMNQVAIAIRAGLLDFEEGPEELDRIERRLHELVDSLRSVAGIES